MANVPKHAKKHPIIGRVRRRVSRDSDFVSTGSTLLNLELSGWPNRGFRRGCYYLIVGDSWSGKTFLSLTCLAEASINPVFDRHRLILDDVEGGSQMNIRQLFGPKLAGRLEPPSRDRAGEPVFSKTIEDFYYNLTDVVETGRPFIYVLDSHDALDSEAAAVKFDKQRRAKRAGEEISGSMGDGKAKTNSGNLRRFMLPLRSNGSILIIINQTRDAINLGGFGPPKGKTRSGGWALKFYASGELWSSVVGDITKTVAGKPRSQGTFCKVKIKKNRVIGKTGKDAEVIVPIYTSYGIDDIGSCIDYLVAENYWTSDKKTGIIEAGEFKLRSRRDVLATKIIERGLQTTLIDIVTRVWRGIQDALTLRRAPKYE